MEKVRHDELTEGILNKINNFLSSKDNEEEETPVLDLNHDELWTLWIEKSEYIWGFLDQYEIKLNAFYEKTDKPYSERKKEFAKLAQTESINIKNISEDLPLPDGNTFVSIYKEMLSDSYVPPPNHMGIFYHLMGIGVLYSNLKTLGNISLKKIFKFEFALMKLINEASTRMTKIQDHGVRELDRLHKAKKRSARKIEKSVDYKEVLDTFRELEKTGELDKIGRRAHTIARKIHEKVSRKRQVPPSLDTIKRWLKRFVLK